jgi:hypothetical protein
MKESVDTCSNEEMFNGRAAKVSLLVNDSKWKTEMYGFLSHHDILALIIAFRKDSHPAFFVSTL